MKNLDTLVIAHFTGVGGKTNNRFGELCTILSDRGLPVELVTSSFRHLKKQHRDPAEGAEVNYRVTYIDEPGYSSNISFRRIRSHRRLAKNLAEYLESRKRPDVIYCAIPSIAVAEEVASFAKRNNIRLIIDVQDLWPEAFHMVFKPSSLARLALSPIGRKADKVYRSADTVVTVSDTYSRRVKKARGGNSNVRTVYLGTNLPKFDKNPSIAYGTSPGTINLVYIGTFGHSYDLPLIFDALRILKDKKIEFVLHMMGTGPLESQWRRETQDITDYVKFYGRLDYPEMVSRLKASDIAMNPIIPGSAGSIINKVCDYAAAGLPVINTQDSKEYRLLLTDFFAGINCKADASEVAAAITKLVQEPELRHKMGIGSRRLAEKYFDRSVTYHQLADLIERND